MISSGDQVSDVHSKSPAVMYLCGATIVLMFSILTFGNASQWFDYVSGVIFVGLAITLAYRGTRLLSKTRVATDSPDTRI